MTDIRLQRMAHTLVHYSLGLKKGDRLAIETGPVATPLVYEVMREALRLGAHPEPFITLPGMRELELQEATDEQLAYIPPLRRIITEEYEALLTISAEENTRELSGIDPSRMAKSQQAGKELFETFMRRSAEGSLRWC